MARERAGLWEAEIERAADGAEIPVATLAALFQTESAEVAPLPWGETEILKGLGRLLVAAAEELEVEADVEAARGGLLGLAQVASLLEVPRLSDWAGRLADSPELTELAGDAARMLRGEAFEMMFAQNLIELRECAWRWPERVVKEPEPLAPGREEEVAEAAVAEPEPIAMTEPEPEPEPVAMLEPEPELEPEPVPPPPAPIVAPRREPARALVADPSPIAAGFLARLLMSRDLRVTMAETAERAAQEVARGGYDVAFVVAEWPVPAAAGTLIVRLFAEGSTPHARAEERILFKPPAAEEVSQILAAWSGAQARPA
jgi:hypothetical protein